MGFFRKECWSGLPLTSPGNLPNPGIEPRSPSLWADSSLFELPRKTREFIEKADSIPPATSVKVWNFQRWVIFCNGLVIAGSPREWKCLLSSSHDPTLVKPNFYGNLPFFNQKPRFRMVRELTFQRWGLSHGEKMWVIWDLQEVENIVLFRWAPRSRGNSTGFLQLCMEHPDALWHNA